MALLPTPRGKGKLCAGDVAVGLTLFWVWRQLPARADISTSALLWPSAMLLLFAFTFAILAGPRLARSKWISDEPIARTHLIALIPLVLVDLFVVNFTTNLAVRR